MNKYDENSNMQTETGNTRRHRKLWIPVLAAITAVITAGTAIGVSASTVEQPAAEEGKVMLNLADTTSLTDLSSTVSSGYILTDVSDVVDEVLPSVVSITSRALVNYFGNSRGYDIGGLDDIFYYFFGDSYGGNGGSRRQEQADPYYYEEEEPQEVDAAMGSGTIVAQNDSELLVLTSYHVVEGSSSLYVTFIDGSNVDGYIKAADEEKDIAVVAIPLDDVSDETLEAIKIATISTEDPDVGDGCIVIGNALGYGISVTSGIISAKDRVIYPDGMELHVIQTDAAINNGNSGGCMLNSRGEVIGISEAKVNNMYAEGMCYAIPVKENLELIQNLMNGVQPKNEDQVASSGTGQPLLGIRGRDVTNELSTEFGMPEGVYVFSTVEGSGAAEAGVMSGDIITGLDDYTVASFADLQYQLSMHNAGDVVTLTIFRLVNGNYEEMSIDVTLAERLG